MTTNGITVIKIGGSTLGSEDTSLQDVVALHQFGARVIVVHGGGAMITDWLKKMEIDSVFVDGLRSTSAAALDVVVGVLRGVVNASLVAEIVAMGGRAVGLSGIDGGCVRAERYDDRLEYVGRVTSRVDGAFLASLLDAGVVPVIAPIGLEAPSQPLNINADTVAGEVARAVRAETLVFLTDVDGLLDGDKTLVAEVSRARADELRAAGVLSGGMIPKVDACFRAAEAGVRAYMANGTQPGTLRRIVAGEAIGTRITRVASGAAMSFFENRDNLGPPPEVFRFGGGEFRSPIPLKVIGIAAALLVTYIVLNVLKSIYVEVLWFDSVGFGGVYRTVIAWKIGLFLSGAVIAGGIIGANVYVARKYAPQAIDDAILDEIDIDMDAVRRIITILLLAVTVFLAVIFGTVSAGAWETILTWRNAVPFGIEDAQFGKDPSFYLFTLPAYHAIQSWLLGVTIVSGLAAGGVYALSMSLRRAAWEITGPMRVHLSVLVGVAFLLIAAATYLGIFELANSDQGIVHGATYTDVHARLPVRYLLIGVSAAAGLVTIANSFLTPSGFRLPLFVVALWLLTGVLGVVAYPSLIQRVQVEPNERAKEQLYIGRNIEATRFAYGLDHIDETTYPANEEVTREELEAHPQTIENIRLLDPIPLRETFNSIQAIRTFYVFNDIDVDRYTIDGKIQQVMIAARELDVLRAQDRNWTRERLQLTHGYGAVISPVNQVGQEGLPELITADIPPRSEEIPITEDGARIYFGESTDQYVIANSVEPEFDYPLGEGNAETFYGEDRGIQLDSIFKRLALAWQLSDQNLLISGQINSDSRLLMHRNIADRIEQVAPFLRLDTDPYLALEAGELMWVQPAYTVASAFPYSQPSGSINYIRHSVTVTVDAQSGDMTFYLTDPSDPVAATWARIFPDLFEEQASMPASIREHLRYPLDMFKVQAGMYLRYHITNPDVFFIGEDFWNIPTEQFQGEEQPVEPYYVLMTLPDGGEPDATLEEEQLEFVLIMPFTPRNRPNTVAWLAGRSDGDQFGALRAYRFPTDALVFGPAQIEARIDQHPAISQQISLWDQSGSEVIRGNLLMIPIGSSFLFVEPIYLQAENSRLPELVRIVVANGNKIAMEPTLDAAIEVLLGDRAATPPGSIDETPGGEAPGATPTATPTATPSATEPLPEGDLRQLLEDARDAQEATQEELDRLRAILDALERELEQQ